MDSKKSDICVFCHYARMKKDICGIYCSGAFWKKPDGTCDHFEDYAEHRKRLRAERKKGGSYEATDI